MYDLYYCIARAEPDPWGGARTATGCECGVVGRSLPGVRVRDASFDLSRSAGTRSAGLFYLWLSRSAGRPYTGCVTSKAECACRDYATPVTGV